MGFIMDNKKAFLDFEYLSIIDEIRFHKEFLKTRDIIHHGLKRYDHNVRVSYYSYKISKFLHLDYESVARAGLLHDFFLSSKDDVKYFDRLKLIVNHPKLALENAREYFDLNEMEEDIILTHMFPVSPFVPKYFESFVVDIVDDVVAICERGYSIRRKLSYAMTFLLLIIFNFIKL